MLYNYFQFISIDFLRYVYEIAKLIPTAVRDRFTWSTRWYIYCACELCELYDMFAVELKCEDE